MDKIQGVEFEDKYELARNIRSKISIIKDRDRIFGTTPKTIKKTMTDTTIKPDAKSKLQHIKDTIKPSKESIRDKTQTKPIDDIAEQNIKKEEKSFKKNINRKIQDIFGTSSKTINKVKERSYLSSKYSVDRINQKEDSLSRNKTDRKGQKITSKTIIIIIITISIIGLIFVLIYFILLPSYNFYTLNNKGSIQENFGNYTEAISLYDKVLAIDPTNVDALNNKGLTLRSLGNYSDAISLYDKVLAIDPTNVDALNNKANLLFNLTR